MMTINRPILASPIINQRPYRAAAVNGLPRSRVFPVGVCRRRNVNASCGGSPPRGPRSRDITSPSQSELAKACVHACHNADKCPSHLAPIPPECGSESSRPALELHRGGGHLAAGVERGQLRRGVLPHEEHRAL